MPVVLALVLTTLFLLTGCDAPKSDDSDTVYTNVSKQQLLGRWTVINYWASWCKPCLEEMPELNRFHRQFSQPMSTQRAQVFAVNFDGLELDALRIESEKLAVNVPLIVNDPSAVLGVDRPTVLPTTLVFDPQGQLKHTLLGPQTFQSLKQLIGLTDQR